MQITRIDILNSTGHHIEQSVTCDRIETFAEARKVIDSHLPEYAKRHIKAGNIDEIHAPAGALHISLGGAA